MQNAYGVGAGDADTLQSRMAIEFYRQVAGNPFDPAHPDTAASIATLYDRTDITVTGHSMGGGLAGLVGSLYRLDGTVFDSMAFRPAANTLDDYRIGVTQADVKSDLYTDELFYQIINGSYGPYYNSNATNQGWITGAYRSDSSGIQSFSVNGEILTYLPAGDSAAQTMPSYILSGIFSQIDAFDLHNAATAVLVTYAETLAPEQQHWVPVAVQFWTSLYDNQLAQFIIGKQISEVGGYYVFDTNGQLNWEPHGFDKTLRTMIAYSAIDEGADDLSARPFGDTGIRALFDDANDLGKYSEKLSWQKGVLSQILVEYAGLLSLNGTLNKDNLQAAQGILHQTNGTLEIDLTDQTWTFGGSVQAVQGRSALFASFLQDHADIAQALGSSLDRVIIRTETVYGPVDFSTHAYTPGHTTLIKWDVAAELTGTAGKDVIQMAGGTVYGMYAHF